MLGDIVQRFEWPLVRKALYKCRPFSAYHLLPTRGWRMWAWCVEPYTLCLVPLLVLWGLHRYGSEGARPVLHLQAQRQGVRDQIGNHQSLGFRAGLV